MTDYRHRLLSAETPKSIGKKVLVAGWVHARRDHGKIVFLDLRDRTGLLQIVLTGDLVKKAEAIRPEYVLAVEGSVKERPANMVNPELPSGTVEVLAEELHVLAEAKTPPIPLDSAGYEIDEELRLKYRYLDIRRERLQYNLRKRAAVARFIRHYLDNLGFTEVETPYITKGTPEGAREFAIPSRLHPGKFYVLPQSPQQFKQLLMVGGMERYYQLARIFRDEDPRADRAYGEATQVDIEMSFVTQEEILDIIEAMFVAMVRDLFPQKRITKVPFPRIPYQEAMDKYATDKPDLRQDKNDPDELSFAFIVDWPLFKWSKEDRRWDPHHHIFTSPKPEDVKFLDKDPGKVHSLQHDFVLNGYEVAGGSIRITDPKIQEKVFELVGIEKEEGRHKFQHMLEAFSFGAPPHGGIAIGFDRVLIPLLGESNLREVIAFPKTGDGRDLMMGAPSDLPSIKIKELNIEIINKAKPSPKK